MNRLELKSNTSIQVIGIKLYCIISKHCNQPTDRPSERPTGAWQHLATLNFSEFGKFVKTLFLTL